MNNPTLPKSVCAECGYETDAATSTTRGDAVEPTPGDISICLNCGLPAVYNDILVLHPMTLEQLATLDGETQGTIEKARRIISKRGRIR